MDNIVTINNTKNNVLAFDISIQGLATDDIRVWFDIKTGNMDIRFECSKKENDSWEVTIPPLPFIDKTAYSCSVSVVADGYFFEPMVGTLNVTGSAEVYVKSSSNQTLKSTESDAFHGDLKGAIKQSDLLAAANRGEPTIQITPLADRPKTKMGERGIAQIAKDMLAGKNASAADGKEDKPKKKKIETKKDTDTGQFTAETAVLDKSDSVKAVLAELRGKPYKAKKLPLSENEKLAASILGEGVKFRKKS